METTTNREDTMTADQLNALADERASYGDTREALELRQKAARIKRETNHALLTEIAERQT